MLCAVLPLLNTEVEAEAKAEAAGVSEKETRRRKRDLLANILLPRLRRKSRKNSDRREATAVAVEEKGGAKGGFGEGVTGAAAAQGVGTSLIDLGALFEAEGLGLSGAEGDTLEEGDIEEIERRQVQMFMEGLRKDVEKTLGPCPHDPNTAYDYRQDLENLKVVTAQIIKKQLRVRRLAALRRRAGRRAGVRVGAEKGGKGEGGEDARAS